uniref:Uncharacterized protein n=1 Tax=Oncorhynchus tshawytscha TaxID=74940 RepID=A0A8C8H2M8_ONCTS
MALRGNGTLITHNNSTYIPPSLMPGYCGYVPTSKYFGAMACSTIPYSRGGMFPSIFSNSGLLVSVQRAQSRSPYWARFNVNFKRQETLKSFGELSQKHRESYKDKTGKRLPVKHFVIPVKEICMNYIYILFQNKTYLTTHYNCPSLHLYFSQMHYMMCPSEPDTQFVQPHILNDKRLGCIYTGSQILIFFLNQSDQL